MITFNLDLFIVQVLLSSDLKYRYNRIPIRYPDWTDNVVKLQIKTQIGGILFV